MLDGNEKPELHFFRAVPNSLMSRPPLCSSLQNLESSFLLMALGRFPHALVTCASSIESAMKAVLRLDSDNRINAKELFATTQKLYPGLATFDKHGISSFRETRNRIAHYGFSPPDDEEAATLLLKTGLPFLRACYKEFFDFDLFHVLDVTVGEQLGIALNVFQKAKGIPTLRFSNCFLAFTHLIRWSVRQSLMADWENAASVRADEFGAKFNICANQKEDLEHEFGLAWCFNCPICRDIETFVCQLDEKRLDDRAIVLARAVCADCGLVVEEMPFLADMLVATQVATKRTEILRAFGIRDA